MPSGGHREGDQVTQVIRDRPLAHLAGIAGIVGQMASAYWYLLYPLLVVPSPASYLFFAAWFILVGLTIAWWRDHPLRSFFVPVVSVPVAIILQWVGTTYLAWAP